MTRIWYELAAHPDELCILREHLVRRQNKWFGIMLEKVLDSESIAVGIVYCLQQVGELCHVYPQLQQPPVTAPVQTSERMSESRGEQGVIAK